MLLLAVCAPAAQARGFRLPFSTTSQTPHPAVARVSVPERGATSHGTGTLVNVAGRHGLIVTNWHVVRAATGEIMVSFPDGFRSAARVLSADQDWDLAALQIWRPAAEPVRLAAVPPRPGDALTIAGYGSGQYRRVSGRCTQYVAPGANLPYEMVELSAEARQGDSGGPIFNDRGELAGVLFGASRGTTSGSYCGRVRAFLATVVSAADASRKQPPVAHPPRNQSLAGSPRRHPPVGAGTRTVIAGGAGAAGPAAEQPGLAATGLPSLPLAAPHPPTPPPSLDPRAAAGSGPYLGASPRVRPTIDLSPPSQPDSLTPPVPRDATPLGGPSWKDGFHDPAPATAADTPAMASWKSLVGETPLRQGKSVLAGIGVLAVLLWLSQLLAGGKN